MKSPKPHRDPFPERDRVSDIKRRLREKLSAEEEVRQAAAAKAEEERKREDAAEAERKQKKPWRLASFFAGEEIALKEEAEKPEEKEEKEKPKQTEPEPEPAREQVVEQGLEAIYMEGDGEVPDLSRFERRRTYAWVKALGLLVVAAGLLAAAAWAGFFLFQPFREFRGLGLKLELAGPAEIALGREETYVLRWSNGDPNPIQSAEVRLGLPQDFIITGLEPAPTEPSARLWRLGLVPVGGGGTITVKGVFVGALGTQSAVQVIGSYRPTGFARDFEALATRAVTYKETVLSGTLTAPPKVLAGDTVAITYAVANRGNQGMEGLLARLHFPAGFVPGVLPTSTQLDLANREAFFPLTTLHAGTTSTVTLQGTFVSGVSGDLAFEGETGRRGPDGAFLAAQRTETRVPVLAGDFTLRFVVNGSDADRSILPSDLLRLALGYQNTSPESLKDVTLRLGFETIVDGKSATGTSLLDWKHLEDFTHGASSTKPRVQTLVYGKGQVSALAELPSQTEGTIELALPTLRHASGTKDVVIRITLEGDIGAVGGTKVNRTVRARPVHLRYRSDANLAVEARYFTEEGAPLGFGPIPPVAGKTTAYRVTWHLTKTLHALDELEVSATLPKIAAWSARTFEDAGKLTYDETSRVVTWKLERVPEEVKELEVSFEVQVTPEQLDVGRFAALLGETRLTAKDPTVGETISFAKPSLTTDLQNDEGARGKGVVRKE